MMEEPGDRGDATRSQRVETRIDPAPVWPPRIIGRDTLPEQRVAQAANPERGDALHIVRASGMPGELELIVVPVVDAVDGALDPAPQLQCRCLHAPSSARRGSPVMRE